MALYNSNNELIVQQTGANNEARPWFASGLLGKVTDFTTKSSKQQPDAVYAAQNLPRLKLMRLLQQLCLLLV